ncbi:MAG: nodulation protein NfeD [Firmicutes bacterium]|nr:nodulation protein NfeD [Bacillota bacterium]
MRRFALGIALAAAFAMAAGAFAAAFPEAAEQPNPQVYVVELNGAVEQALARYVTRVFDTAEREKAAAVIVEISTPGGRIDSAIAIKDRIVRSPVKTIAYVRDHAWSAGALITLSAEKVAMAPGSSIGSAEPRPLDEKVLSAWRAELESTAERRRRDPKLAAGMADAGIEIPGVKEKGKLLNLTWKRALELGISDATAADRDEVLASFGLQGARVVTERQTPAERLARFVSNPIVAPVILTIGFLGMVVEAMTPGFGIPGLVGLSAFALYFGGQAAAGAAGWEVAALFLLGVLLLTVEAFMPGFGVFGFSGIASMILSIYFAIARSGQGIEMLLIAVAASALALLVAVRFGLRRGIWRRLTLASTLSGTSARGPGEPGQVPESLAGKTGIALTHLRPAGVVEIDGMRVDVITRGEFIDRGQTVYVLEDSGGTVVVTFGDGQRDDTPGKPGRIRASYPRR